MRDNFCTEQHRRVQYPQVRPAECHLDDGGPCEYCLKLAELDCRAAELLERLSREREALLRNINRRHDPYILRLPIELASRIFQLCLPSDEENGEEERLLGKYYDRIFIELPPEILGPFVPLNLAMVCHQWRQIACSTSRLWTSMPIYLTKNAYKLKNQLEIICCWTAWAGSLPLSIGVWDVNAIREIHTDDDDPSITLALNSTYNFVNSLTPRWKSLKVSVPLDAIHRITGNGEAPLLLQNLQIDFPGPDDQEPENITFSLIHGQKPSPKKLDFYSLSFHNMIINWSQLLDLTIHWLQIDDTVAILQEASLLQALHVDITMYGCNPHLQGRLRHVVHTNLKTLSIYDASGDLEDQTPLWDFFTFPSLTTLDYRDPNDHIESFLAMISRSNCPLENCAIVKMFNEDFRNEFFGLVPSLRSLYVKGQDSSIHVMKLLTQNAIDRPQQPVALRNLQAFRIDVLSKDQVDVDQSLWWNTYLDFITVLACGDPRTLPLKFFYTKFTEDRFAGFPLPSDGKLDSLPTLIYEAMCDKGVEVRMYDKGGADILDHIATYPKGLNQV